MDEKRTDGFKKDQEVKKSFVQVPTDHFQKSGIDSSLSNGIQDAGGNKEQGIGEKEADNSQTGNFQSDLNNKMGIRELLWTILLSIIPLLVDIAQFYFSHRFCSWLDLLVTLSAHISVLILLLFLFFKKYKQKSKKLTWATWFGLGFVSAALIIMLVIYSGKSSISYHCNGDVSGETVTPTSTIVPPTQITETALPVPTATNSPIVINSFREIFNKAVWNISDPKFTGRTYRDFPDYYNFSEYGFDTIRDINKVKDDQIWLHKQLTSVNSTSSFVSRLNGRDEFYKITISDLFLDFADPCPETGFCDVQLVIGLDNEVIHQSDHIVKSFDESEPGFGKYIVFRVYQDLNTGERMRVICMPVNIYDSCEDPITYNGGKYLTAQEFKGPWTVIIDKSGSLVSFQLLDKDENAVADTGNLNVDKNAYLWIGYYIKNKGEVSAYLTGPVQ
jgi:hypothetical protein